MTIPESERIRFESYVQGQADRYGLTPEDYLRKVWYHEEAARIGEYMAMTLLEQLLTLAPVRASEEEKAEESGVVEPV